MTGENTGLSSHIRIFVGMTAAVIFGGAITAVAAVMGGDEAEFEQLVALARSKTLVAQTWDFALDGYGMSVPAMLHTPGPLGGDATQGLICVDFGSGVESYFVELTNGGLLQIPFGRAARWVADENPCANLAVR